MLDDLDLHVGYLVLYVARLDLYVRYMVLYYGRLVLV